MKTMKVVLEIDVDDLSAEKRAECASDMEIPVEEIPTLADTEAPEAASVLRAIGEHTCEELFAGSDVYVTFKHTRVISAGWID
jgi:hypothetical protein